MDGIVSLLDDEHDRRTRALWAELEADFGLRGVYTTPYPHFSYHVAKAYQPAGVEAALKQVAGQLAPFTVTTAGLGVFSGPAPVLYLPIIRTAALSSVQARVWEAVHPHSASAEVFYQPDRWMPHITLGFGDLTPEALGRIMARLGARRFAWVIPIRDLSLLANDGAGPAAPARWRLGR